MGVWKSRSWNSLRRSVARYRSGSYATLEVAHGLAGRVSLFCVTCACGQSLAQRCEVAESRTSNQGTCGSGAGADGFPGGLPVLTYKQTLACLSTFLLF